VLLIDRRPPMLPTFRVDVVESGGRARRLRVKCEIGANLRFDAELIQSYCLAEWDPTVFDALVVAAAVQFCDHSKRRLSASWGREFELRIPVHDTVHWKSESVSTALHLALAFVTGDRWNVSFVERRSPAPSCAQLRFDISEHTYVVVPFSNGLDSLAVALLMEKEYGQDVLRVRLGSVSKALHRNGLEGRRIPFTSVPYEVTCEKRSSVESTGRSRGFTFALLGGIAAHLSNAAVVALPESGQGAIGPSLVPVGQVYEDYRNHPSFTHRMERLVSAVFGRHVSFDHPRLWYTKAETLMEVERRLGNDVEWAITSSCWRDARQASVGGKLRQCGVCGACMLRRMSMHAMGRREGKETFVWEDLTVDRFEDGAAPTFKISKHRGALFESAIAGTLQLDQLARLHRSVASQSGLDRQVSGLSASLGLPEETVRAKLMRVLRQHEREWKSFLSSLGRESFVSHWVSGA